MTNINIQVPNDVHKELKIRAAIEQKPLKELITTLLEGYLQQKGGGQA